jgi:O-antigen ligase
MTAALRARIFDPQALARLADWLAAGVAVSLPWSTLATSVLIVLWLAALLPTLSVERVRRELVTAAGGLPVLLWVLAAVGLLWADVAWSERLAAFERYHRLLAVPLLLAQFRRSAYGPWVFYGYLASALSVLAASFALALLPGLNWRGFEFADATDRFGRRICGLS